MWVMIPGPTEEEVVRANGASGLTTTSRSEAQIAAYSAQRPSTAASTASHNLSQIIPTLLTTIETENETSQDAFQAHVCLGWLHYVLDEPGLAVAHLPKDFRAATASMSEGGTLTGWSRVCVVKGTYLRGTTPTLFVTPYRD
jgi:hypothetical protein